MRLGGDNEGRNLYAIRRLEGNSSKGINILLHDSPKNSVLKAIVIPVVLS